jgi:hypothetical protein
MKLLGGPPKNKKRKPSSSTFIITSSPDQLEVQYIDGTKPDADNHGGRGVGSPQDASSKQTSRYLNETTRHARSSVTAQQENNSRGDATTNNRGGSTKSNHCHSGHSQRNANGRANDVHQQEDRDEVQREERGILEMSSIDDDDDDEVSRSSSVVLSLLKCRNDAYQQARDEAQREERGILEMGSIDDDEVSRFSTVVLSFFNCNNAPISKGPPKAFTSSIRNMIHKHTRHRGEQAHQRRDEQSRVDLDDDDIDSGLRNIIHQQEEGQLDSCLRNIIHEQKEWKTQRRDEQSHSEHDYGNDQSKGQPLINMCIDIFCFQAWMSRYRDYQCSRREI